MSDQGVLGAYLVNRGLIDENDWMETLENQSRGQTPIGKIALREGMLTVRQVQEILRVSAGSKVFFGDVAVELGFLDMDQIGLLLTAQRNERPEFASTLNTMNRVDPTRLKEAIEDWKRGLS